LLGDELKVIVSCLIMSKWFISKELLVVACFIFLRVVNQLVQEKNSLAAQLNSLKDQHQALRAASEVKQEAAMHQTRHSSSGQLPANGQLHIYKLNNENAYKYIYSCDSYKTDFKYRVIFILTISPEIERSVHSILNLFTGLSVGITIRACYLV